MWLKENKTLNVLDCHYLLYGYRHVKLTVTSCEIKWEF